MGKPSSAEIALKYSPTKENNNSKPTTNQPDPKDENGGQDGDARNGECQDGLDLVTLRLDQLQTVEVSVAPSHPTSFPLCTSATPATVLLPASPPMCLLDRGPHSVSIPGYSPLLSPPSSLFSQSAPFKKASDGPSPCPSTSDNDFSDISDSSSDWEITSTGNRAYDMATTPRVAKDLSVFSGSFYPITTFEDGDLVPEDEPKDQGWVLHGYDCGKPVYLSTTDGDVVLKSIETKTVLGRLYVTQPVESCFSADSKPIGKAVFNTMESFDTASGTPKVDLPLSSAGNSFSADSGIGMDIDDDLIELKNVAPAEALEPSLPPHRTFSNKWLKVAPSSLGGYGIFAEVDIPKHTHILLEKPFLACRHLGRLKEKYSKLSKEQKAVYDDLHPYDKTTDCPIKQRWNANSFWARGYEIVLAVASNFNHACHSKRTAQYCWDDNRKVMVFTAMKDIKQGNEIFISYGQYAYTLQEKFGFVCECGGCVAGGSHNKWSFVGGTDPWV